MKTCQNDGKVFQVARALLLRWSLHLTHTTCDNSNRARLLNFEEKKSI